MLFTFRERNVTDFFFFNSLLVVTPTVRFYFKTTTVSPSQRQKHVRPVAWRNSDGLETFADRSISFGLKGSVGVGVAGPGDESQYADGGRGLFGFFRAVVRIAR